MTDDQLLDHPRQYAETRRFSLGRPRAYRPFADGRVLYLRADGATDPVLRLRELDLASGADRVVVDPTTLDVPGDEDLPAEERARRERAREAAGGIVSFTADEAGTTVAFTLAGQLFRADVASGEVTACDAPAGAYDPHLDPTGHRLGFVADGRLFVATEGAAPVEVAGDDDPDVTWGVADFAAAEELGRQRGFWWSPDGERLLAARVDNRPVARWHIGDPANPDREPTLHRYPAAGTANAEVSLALFPAEGGEAVEVAWDRDAFPYLASVRWDDHGPCLLVVLDRAQTILRTLSLDPATGATEVVHEATQQPWVEVPAGAPRWLPDGRLLTIVDDLDAGEWGTRGLAVDGARVTPDGLQVSHVAGVGDDGTVWFAATEEPTEQHVLRLRPDGTLEAVTTEPGVHAVAVGGGVEVLVSTGPDRPDLDVEVRGAEGATARIESLHARPVVTPRPRFVELGEEGLRGALLLPSDDDGTSPLPVVLDPYGGPHAQRCVKSQLAFTTSQWLADQGFAVLVVDGRGSPSRGPRWEHRIHLDFADGVLADQVTALQAAKELEPRLDLDRVAIRGWSYGGYLSALAVLRRPDVFRAGVAGAPVTDWRLYDTAYTERYLGHPDEHADAYRASSLVDDEGLVDAADWDPARPPKLLVVHGLADDNVVAAHALRLSAALLAAGRPHQFLPLSGVTHMTPQVVVAENLLRLELGFLREALGA